MLSYDANNSDVAYIDPNTYGEGGYSLIGPLLLFYKKIVIYGPSGFLIEKSFESHEYNKTSLTPCEFMDYIGKGLIVPLGFDSFFNKEERNRLPFESLRIITDLDKEIISSPYLLNKCIRVANNFKTDISPILAKKILANKSILNRLSAELIHKDGLPNRYKDLSRSPEQIPSQLKHNINHEDAKELLPYLIIYDLLNDRYVMDQSPASVHTLHPNFRGLYHAISPLGPEATNGNGQAEIIAKVLERCVSEIKYGRLDSDQIDEFRDKYRDSFILAINEAFAEFSEVEDFHKKKERILSHLSDKIERMKIHLTIGPEKLISLIPCLKIFSAPLSKMFHKTPGKFSNKAYHSFYKPMSPKARWMYHFLKFRK